MITNVNFYENMRGLNELANEYGKELSVENLDSNLSPNTNYVMQILDDGNVHDTLVFFTWNTDNALYPYTYKYELVLVEGVIEDTENKFNQFSGVQILRNFEGFGEEYSPSMQRFGKPNRDENSTLTVVGFIGSIHELPVNSPIISMIDADDYSASISRRIYNEFVRIFPDVDAKFVSISINYEYETYESFGILTDAELEIPDILKDKIVDWFSVIMGDNGMPKVIKSGHLSEDDDRVIGGYYYTIEYFSLPLEDNEEEEVIQVHFL